MPLIVQAFITSFKNLKPSYQIFCFSKWSLFRMKDKKANKLTIKRLLYVCANDCWEKLKANRKAVVDNRSKYTPVQHH